MIHASGIQRERVIWPFGVFAPHAEYGWRRETALEDQLRVVEVGGRRELGAGTAVNNTRRSNVASISLTELCSRRYQRHGGVKLLLRRRLKSGSRDLRKCSEDVTRQRRGAEYRCDTDVADGDTIASRF